MKGYLSQVTRRRPGLARRWDWGASWLGKYRSAGLDGLVVLSLVVIAAALAHSSFKLFSQPAGYVIQLPTLPDEAKTFGVTPSLVQSELLRALRRVAAEAAAMSDATIEAETLLGTTDPNRGISAIRTGDREAPSIDVKIPDVNLSLSAIRQLTAEIFGLTDNPIRSEILCKTAACAGGYAQLIITVAESQSAVVNINLNNGEDGYESAAKWIYQFIDPYVLAAWYLQLGNFDAAERYAVQASYYFPRRKSSALAFIGLLRLRHGDLDAAQKYLESALGVDPFNATAISGSLELYEMRADNEIATQNAIFAAIEYSLNSIRKSSNIFDPFRTAESLFDTPASTFERSTYLESRDRESEFESDASYYRDRISRVKFLKEVIKYNFGVRAENSHDYEPAAAHFRGALEVNPFDERSVAGQGESLLMLGRVDEAREIYTRGRVLAPRDPAILRGFTCIDEYLTQGDGDADVYTRQFHMHRCLKLDP